MANSLTDLPPEVLNGVFAHLDTVRSMRNLSLTCKRILARVEHDGYRTLVQKCFPSYSVPPPQDTCPELQKSLYWKDAVHSMTSLSRNLDRRALLGLDLHDPHRSLRRSHRPGTQSMGYVPVIDSYQTWAGGDWASREETVAWGAGAHVLLRSRRPGHLKLEGVSKDTSPRRYFQQEVDFAAPDFAEGKDDVVSLHLLQRQSDGVEQCIVGRSSGHLALVGLTDGHSLNPPQTIYDTKGESVRSSTFDHSSGLLVACLSDTLIKLYQTASEQATVEPLLTTNLRGDTGHKLRTWTSKFLNTRTLAIGTGHSPTPISIFDVERGDLQQPLRSIKNDSKNPNWTGTTIRAIVPLPSSTVAIDSPGDLFLSGASDGCVSLHDLRCQDTVVQNFNDPINAGITILSLLPIGREKIVAGGSMHALVKIFDLRLPGERLYSSMNLLPCLDEPESTASAPNCCRLHRTADEARAMNWNVFLRQHSASPVYSLSRPSSVSPTFYAGTEGAVSQINWVSLLDRHPDDHHKALLQASTRPIGMAPSPFAPPPPSSSRITTTLADRTTRGNDRGFGRGRGPRSRAQSREEDMHPRHEAAPANGLSGRNPELRWWDMEVIRLCMYDHDLIDGKQRMRVQSSLSYTQPASAIASEMVEPSRLTLGEQVRFFLDERWHQQWE